MSPLAAQPAFSLPPTQRLLELLWSAPFPATLQDAGYRLLAVNDAFCAMCGRPREALLGIDPIELQPPEDREGSGAERDDYLAALAAGTPLPPLRRRLVDAQGRQRWFTLAIQNLAGDAEPPLWLAVLQDVSAEYAARDQARRLQDELAQWFELAGAGMLVYDPTGLIVRSNAAFEALVGRVPEVLSEASPELQALLGWEGESILPGLVPGAPPIEQQAIVPLPDGRRRRLAARLACLTGEPSAPGAPRTRRVMAVIEDRSAEDERDLAQLEMGMLMDTASVGVATFDPSRGWLAPRRPAAAMLDGEQAARAGAAGAPDGAAPAPTPASSSSGALLAIGRELVEPDSLPEYERLQRALRQGERTEVRYAVRHPELGTRWLLTRVEPGALAGGRTTTSVVTLDVTEQERAQRRNEQLLRELTTILDSSTAGIAYLRGPVLVRCNRRFERMLGYGPGAAAGATLEEMLRRQRAPRPLLDAALQALAEGRPFEAELELAARPPRRGALAAGEPVPRWVALSVRRADALTEQTEAVAVLTDVTRLKAQQAELEQIARDRETMFNLSEVGIAYLRGARVERANQAMARLTGYAAPELTQLDPAELYVDARECVEFEARIAEALRETGRFAGERRLRRRDGSLRWVQVTARLVPAEPVEAAADDAAPASASGDGMICSFIDVDERRRARESLTLQAERTRAVLDSVLVGIVTVSDRGIEWLNRSARRMFGGELSDFVGEPIATVATAEAEHPLRRTDWFDRLPEGGSETFECRLKGRDGREFWVVGNVVLTGRGEAAEAGSRQLSFALLDIERRRQAEMNIAQAQARLQRVIETAPLAIALFDARSLRVINLNQAATGFFGRSAAEARGLPVEQAAAGADPAQAAALRGWLEAAVASGQPSQHEWREAAPAGDPAALAADADEAHEVPRVWDCRIAPLAGSADEDGGNAAGDAQILFIASDVTEQRAADDKRLQAAIAQREVLVREVHHRIKNNLQGVAGLLQQSAQRHPELSVPLSEAVGQVQAIAQVYGLQVGAQGPLAVAGLIEAIASSVQRTFGRPIEVAAAGVPHLLPEAEAIPVALTVNELLTNAIKHGQGGGAVRCMVDPATPAPGAPEGSDGGVRIRIASRSRLPEGFDLALVRGGVSGLGLVRALLPRRSSALEIAQHGDEVIAAVVLRAPSVRRPGEVGAAPVAVGAGAASARIAA